MKYKKKPLPVEAFKWTADIKQDNYPGWFFEAICINDIWIVGGNTENARLMVKTADEIMEASIGDYILHGADGEIYPCKKDVFEYVYELDNQNEFGEQPITLDDLLDDVELCGDEIKPGCQHLKINGVEIKGIKNMSLNIDAEEPLARLNISMHVDKDRLSFKRNM